MAGVTQAPVAPFSVEPRAQTPDHGAAAPAASSAGVVAPSTNIGNPQPITQNRASVQGTLGFVSDTVPTMPTSFPLSPTRVLFRPMHQVGQGAPSNVLHIQALPAQQEDHPARKPVRQLDFTSMYEGVSTSGDTSVRPVPTRALSPPRASKIRAALDSKEGTPKKCKQCNCKNSRCLKLYCECFASGVYCDGCNCVNCCNNVENEAFRKEAVEATLERNPNAFRPKIASSHGAQRENRDEAGELPFIGRHNKGCHCKKSGCLKKYCECFQANILCSDNCKCIDCKNYENSEERRALFHGEAATNLSYTLHPGMSLGVGGSLAYSSPLPVSKKRRTHDLVFVGHGLKEQGPPQRPPHVLQASNVRVVPVSSNSYLAGMPMPAPSVPTSKVSYSSLLTGVVEPIAIRDLCTLLVFVSAEAAQASNDTLDVKASDGASMDNSTSASVKHSDPPAEQAYEHHMNPQDSGNEEAGERCTVQEASGPNTDATGESRPDVPKQSAMSPGTLALMCDEQDSLFTAPTSPSASNVGSTPMQKSSLSARAHAAQEKAILSEFRNCLMRIVSVGNKRATQYSAKPVKVELPLMSQLQQLPQPGGPQMQQLQIGPSSRGVQSMPQIQQLQPGPRALGASSSLHMDQLQAGAGSLGAPSMSHMMPQLQPAGPGRIGALQPAMAVAQPVMGQSLGVRPMPASSFSMPNGFPVISSAAYVPGVRAQAPSPSVLVESAPSSTTALQ